MTTERCGICEAGDRDLGILLASASVTPSQLTQQKVVAAYARLSPWVGHLRVLPNAADHLATLKLPNLSGTAYVQNVLQVVSNPRLQDVAMASLSRLQQDEVIASALVLLLSGAHVWPAGVQREVTERIARSWGWSG